MGAHELTAALWRERAALESLLATQRELRGLLVDKRLGWIGQALDDQNGQLDTLRALRLGRDVDVADAAGVWGAPETIELWELPAAAPSPWAEIVAEHITEMRAIADRVRLARRENDTLLRAADLVADTRRWPNSTDPDWYRAPR